MKPTAVLAVLAVVLATPADAQSDGASPTLSPCSGRLSGAVTATFDCQVEATWDAKEVRLVVAAQGPVGGVRSFVPARLVLPYPLESRTYVLSGMLGGEARIVLAGGAEYVASGAKGEVTLDVNGLERYQKPRQRYQLTGTIRARLVPIDPAGTAEVHLDLRF